ncbi:hypothetical protein ICN84_01890 [Akkermansia glycaniphila]|uniref:hypothetical protein n=1 Tax=Akkermansia glycaniphila TaxID=1679444 RepID=UPI001C014C2E|nr:hypothetical protein [Akkermansia glycaniphila]MBT9448821.1 hypothetical protein [Akkermansia glycaniphila]
MTTLTSALGLMLIASGAIAETTQQPATPQTARPAASPGAWPEKAQKLLTLLQSLTTKEQASKNKHQIETLTEHCQALLSDRMEQDIDDPGVDAEFQAMGQLYLPAVRLYHKLRASGFLSNSSVEEACMELVNSARTCLYCDRPRAQILFSGFRLNPDPELAAALLDLRSDDYMSAYRIGFFSALFKLHPEYANQWQSINNRQHFNNILAAALWFADTPQTREIRTKIRPSSSNRPDIDLKRIDLARTDPSKPHADEYPEIANLDMAWGAFDATNDSDYLNGILLCALRQPTTDEPDLMKLNALWSLRLRAANEKDISAQLEQCLSKLPVTQQKEYAAMPTPDFDDISNFSRLDGAYLRILEYEEQKKVKPDKHPVE